MRYGLADARNYDSIESSRSLDWFEPLYEPEPGRASRSSRRTIRWEGVVRGVLGQLAYLVVFLTAAWANFATKDINS